MNDARGKSFPPPPEHTFTAPTIPYFRPFACVSRQILLRVSTKISTMLIKVL